MAEEQGAFAFADVVDAIAQKMLMHHSGGTPGSFLQGVNAHRSFSLIARSTRHRRFPNPFSLDIEDEIGVSRRSGPVIACELNFELTRRPTCVAESDQCFLRAGLVTDVTKHVPTWRNGGEFADSDGVGAIVVSAVYDEADSRLHRAAREDLHFTFSGSVTLAKKPKKLRQRMFP